MATLHQSNSPLHAYSLASRYVVFGLFTFLAAELGQMLSFRAESLLLPSFWPPIALLLAALVVGEAEEWISFLIAGLVGQLFSSVLVHQQPIQFAFVMWLGNGGGAMLGASVVRMLAPTDRKHLGIHNLPGLVTLPAILCTLVSSLWAVGILATLGFRDVLWPTFCAYWVGQVLSILVLVPVVLSWFLNDDDPDPMQTHESLLGEALAFFVVLLVCSWLVFSGRGGVTAVFPSLLLPLLLFVTLRYGLSGISVAIAMVSAVALYHGARDQGLIGQLPLLPHQKVLVLEAILCVYAGTFGVLGVLLHRRKTTVTQDLSPPAWMGQLRDGVVITEGPEMKVVYWNEGAERLYGIRAGDALGRRQADLFGYRWLRPDDEKEAERSIRGMGGWDGENLIVRLDGRTVHAESAVQVSYDPQGHLVNSISVAREIEATPSATDEYRPLVENALEGFLRCAPDGRLTLANAALARIFGYATVDTMLQQGDRIGEMLVSEPARRREFYRQLETLGEVRAFEAEGQRRDGSAVWLEHNLRAVRDPKGSVLHYEGTLEDITSRKYHELATQQRLQLLQRITESIPPVIYLLDLQDQRNVFVSRQIAHDLGYSVNDTANWGNDLLGRLMHPDDLARLPERFAQWQQPTRNGQSWRSEYRLRAADGTWHWFEGRESVFQRGQDGRAIQIIGTMTEIAAPRPQADPVVENVIVRESANEPDVLTRLATTAQALLYLRDLEDGRVTYLSPNSARLLGYDPNQTTELARRFLSDLVPTENVVQMLRRPEDWKRSVEDSVVEFRVRAADGSPRWFRGRETVFSRDAEGRVRQVAGAALDLTDSRRQFEEEGQSRAWIAAMAESAPVAWALLDRDFKFLALSKEWRSLFNLGNSELTGRHLREGIPSTRKKREWDEIRRQCLAGQPQQIEEESAQSVQSGNEMWYRWEMRPWTDRTGQTAGAILVAENLTDRRRSDRNLREAEERYRLLATLAARFLYAFRIRPDDTIQTEWLGGKYEEFTGRSSQELVDFRMLFRYEDQETITQHIHDLRTHGQAAMEASVLTSRGVPVPVRVTSCAIGGTSRDADVWVYGAILDPAATADRSESAPSAELERYRLLAGITSDFTYAFQVNPDGSYLIDWLEGDFQRVTGYSKKELQKLGWRRLFHPEDLDEIERLANRLQPGESSKQQFRIVTRSGQTRWLENHCHFLPRSRSDSAAPILGGAVDITDRRQAAPAQPSRQFPHFQHLLDGADQIFRYVTLNPEKIEYVNPAFDRVWGVRGEELSRDPRAWLRLIHDEDGPGVLEKYDAWLRQIEPNYQAEFRVVRPDGSLRWISEHGATHREPNGEIRGFSIYSRDVTQRRHAEETLHRERQNFENRLNEQGWELTQLRSRPEPASRPERRYHSYLPSMHDELRQPLDSILKLTDSLRSVQSQLSPNQQEDLRGIESYSRSLMRRLDDVVDVARLDTDRFEVRHDDVNVRGLCESALQSVRTGADRGNLNLRLHVEQQVRSVSGDERLLKQALVHLLENAVKYTPTGGNVTLEATGDPDHKQMHFTVSDTGMGIPSDLRSRLFEPIFHRETTATQSVSGTGIGLHLVSRIAEAHGGRVDVDSELGSGSRFVITLPWAGPRFGREAPAEEYTRPTPTEDRELLRPAQVRGNRVQALEQQLSDLQSAVDRTLASLPEGEPLQLARQQPRPKLRLHRNEEALRVLVVDSQTPIVNALREYLPKRGYRLSFAPTLAAGLELAAADRPDALMVDPDMENGAGLDAIRQFREVLGPVTLIVAMKANLDEEFRDLCTLAGASDFVNKPLKLKHVVRTLDTQLRNGSGSAE